VSNKSKKNKKEGSDALDSGTLGEKGSLWSSKVSGIPRRVTDDGISLDPLYHNLMDSKEYLSSLGFPGSYPYTRGVYPSMYLERPWTMRQYSGFGTVEETNTRFRYLIKEGVSGLSVAFDLPTQMGRDSDDPMAEGEVGRVGVAIDTVDDMDRLFDGISLSDISTSMTINATAHILLAFYLVVAERRGIAFNTLRGTVQNDILKEYIARGTYVYPPKAGIKITSDIIEYCSIHVPKWNTISISGYHVREAGSTAAQEIAITLSNGLTYIEEVLKRGLSIDDFAPRLAFFFNCHNDFFEEIAKFRAARRLWARLLRERYNPKNEKSLMLRFHTQTAGSSLTAQQPQVNVVRTTIQAMAAALGGTQSLHTNSYDEAISLPSQDAALLALRTQQVLQEETGITQAIDPLGGSFYVEQMTDELEAKALEIMSIFESAGGMVAAIEKKLPQQLIEDAAYRYQKDLEQDRKKVVGVNCYKDSGESVSMKRFSLDPESERRQRESLMERKKTRDDAVAKNSLVELKSAAENNRNIMPSVLDVARRGGTLGEISGILREVYGMHRE
jgi:methylmalonyl-CoA mutase, N-terminal domain